MIKVLPNVGIRIASRITDALIGHGIPYQDLVDIVYDTCITVAHAHVTGDWIEMPNGDVYTKTFTAKEVD